MRRILMTVVCAGCLFAAGARADDASEFFNGKNTDGWEGRTEFWKVEGGAIVGDTGKGINFNTFLCSKKKYGDFELSFQVRLKEGKGNSGVQIRSQLIEMKNYAVGGPQADIGGGYWGSLYGERFSKEGKIGGGHMMKAADAKKVGAVLKKDDFNDYSIRCVGKKVTIKVNGETSVDEEFPNIPDTGIIAWQLHGGPAMEVTFKNIKFKDLGKKSGAALEKHEKVMEEMLGLMKELLQAFESVKDRATAKTAAGRINKVCDGLEAVAKRAKDLPNPPPDVEDRLKKKYEPELKKLAEQMGQVAFKAGQASGGEPSFLEAAQRLAKVGEALQSLGK